MIKVVAKTQSSKGRDIKLLSFSQNKGGKTVLIVGVFHGDEVQGEFLIENFIKERKSPPKNNVLMLPCLNPDGKELKTRQNANGIDLNRNFPTKNRKIISDKQYYGGSIPGSEPETRFITDIIEKYEPKFILTIHSPYKVVNFDGPAKEQAEQISKITGYPVSEYIGYETPGSFGTYAGKERQIPVITLEVDEKKSNDELWNDLKDVFTYCADIV